MATPEVVLGPNQGVIMELHPDHGDSRLIWDRTKPDEVEAARAHFDALKKKRYLPFKVNAEGNKGELVTAFDPQEERYILVPAQVGG